MNDSPIPPMVCALLLIFSGYTCHEGYQGGYQDHRIEVCARSHGVWMTAEVDGQTKHRCIHGGDR